MQLKIERYYRDGWVVKGMMSVDGRKFCETREPGDSKSRRHVVEPGRYECRCVAADFSAMALKVCRGRGQPKVLIGFHPVKQRVAGLICLGWADVYEEPDARELMETEETFRVFTKMVYTAFSRGETFELEVTELPPTA